MRQQVYIGYCRVSKEEQARDGASLRAQAIALRAWAEQEGVEIRLLFERGCSGKRGSKRPKLDAALVALHAKDGPAGLVVHRLDRLSRPTIDFGLWLEQAQKRGWRVVLLDLGVDTNTPQGEAMAGQLVVMAQFERRLIGQRTKDALAVRRAQGIHTGRRSTLPDDVVQRILGDAARGRSNADIAPVAQRRRGPHGPGRRPVVAVGRSRRSPPRGVRCASAAARAARSRVPRRLPHLRPPGPSAADPVCRRCSASPTRARPTHGPEMLVPPPEGDQVV